MSKKHLTILKIEKNDLGLAENNQKLPNLTITHVGPDILAYQVTYYEWFILMSQSTSTIGHLTNIS